MNTKINVRIAQLLGWKDGGQINDGLLEHYEDAHLDYNYNGWRPLHKTYYEIIEGIEFGLYYNLPDWYDDVKLAWDFAFEATFNKAVIEVIKGSDNSVRIEVFTGASREITGVCDIEKQSEFAAALCLAILRWDQSRKQKRDKPPE